jgi:hypothetical protein
MLAEPHRAPPDYQCIERNSINLDDHMNRYFKSVCRFVTVESFDRLSTLLSAVKGSNAFRE